MITDEERRRFAQILEERTLKDKYKGPWMYEGSEVPEALRDDLGAELVEYVLEEDNQYISSSQISNELEADCTPKKIGLRMRLIGRTLGLEDEEAESFNSNKTTWDLEAFQNIDELYEKIPENREK